jgi:hypothetical protein
LQRRRQLEHRLWLGEACSGEDRSAHAERRPVEMRCCVDFRKPARGALQRRRRPAADPLRLCGRAARPAI